MYDFQNKHTDGSLVLLVYYLQNYVLMSCVKDTRLQSKQDNNEGLHLEII